MISRIKEKLNREIGKRMFCKNVQFPSDRKVVSFTFDDFPMSAIDNGALILEQAGMRGTFYASLGFFDEDKFPTRKKITELLERGHEIGCHTYSHTHCGAVPLKQAEADCLKNINELQEITGKEIRSFAFPFGEFSPASKKLAGKLYDTARMVQPGINRNTIDLSALYAVPVDMRGGIDSVKHWMDNLEQFGGWAICYTHAVCSDPTDYDSTEELLEEAVAICKAKRFEVMTVREASELCKTHNT